MNTWKKSINKALVLFDNTKQVNVYAAIYDKKDNLIADATNSYIKTHPLQKQFATLLSFNERIYLHAEIAALIRSKGKGNTMHIIRLSKDKKFILPSKPCPICQLALQDSNITNFVYTTTTTIQKTNEI